MEQEKSGIEDAVAAAGSQAALGEKLGVSQQVVSSWERRGWVPALRAIEIEQVYGIPRKRLVNPRLFDLVGAETEGR